MGFGNRRTDGLGGNTSPTTSINNRVAITDMPFQSYNGFLDVIELKLPDAQFWTNELNPTSSDLTSAIMQCVRYLRIAEQKSNDLAKSKEFGCKIVKPRITLIYGKSNEWTKTQQEQFRVLNSTLTNIPCP